jgi:hypothetical protein
MVGDKLDAICDELGVAIKKRKRIIIVTPDQVDDPYFFNQYPIEDDDILKSLNQILQSPKQRKIWVNIILMRH